MRLAELLLASTRTDRWSVCNERKRDEAAVHSKASRSCLWSRRRKICVALCLPAAGAHWGFDTNRRQARACELAGTGAVLSLLSWGLHHGLIVLRACRRVTCLPAPQTVDSMLMDASTEVCQQSQGQEETFCLVVLCTCCTALTSSTKLVLEQLRSGRALLAGKFDAGLSSYSSPARAAFASSSCPATAGAPGPQPRAAFVTCMGSAGRFVKEGCLLPSKRVSLDW